MSSFCLIISNSYSRGLWSNPKPHNRPWWSWRDQAPPCPPGTSSPWKALLQAVLLCYLQWDCRGWSHGREQFLFSLFLFLQLNLCHISFFLILGFQDKQKLLSKELRIIGRANVLHQKSFSISHIIPCKYNCFSLTQDSSFWYIFIEQLYITSITQETGCLKMNTKWLFHFQDFQVCWERQMIRK